MKDTEFNAVVCGAVIFIIFLVVLVSSKIHIYYLNFPNCLKYFMYIY